MRESTHSVWRLNSYLYRNVAYQKQNTRRFFWFFAKKNQTKRKSCGINCGNVNRPFSIRAICYFVFGESVSHVSDESDTAYLASESYLCSDYYDAIFGTPIDPEAPDVDYRRGEFVAALNRKIQLGSTINFDQNVHTPSPHLSFIIYDASADVVANTEIYIYELILRADSPSRFSEFQNELSNVRVSDISNWARRKTI